MAVVVSTRNRQRARLRPGRRVQYQPTASEVNTYGEGPFSATIAEVNRNGTVDITVTFPAPIAGYGSLDSIYDGVEQSALLDVTVRRRLQNVVVGGLAGQCFLFGPAT